MEENNLFVLSEYSHRRCDIRTKRYFHTEGVKYLANYYFQCRLIIRNILSLPTGFAVCKLIG